MSQPTPITLSNSSGNQLTLNYAYCAGGVSSCSNNNGNVLSGGIITPALNLSQSFGYDLVNRLTSEAETGGSSECNQTYSYDQWGNRAVSSSCIPNAYATPTALTQYSNNQWLGSGAGYDLGGNQTSLPSRMFTYDAEDRLITSTQPNTGAIQYAYDGEGRRVMKTVGTTSTLFVYDGMGQLAAEYGPSSASGTQYLVSDALGSTRLLLNSTGAVAERFDYLPFGEELTAGLGSRTTAMGYSTIMYPAPPDQQDIKFTAKERDAESGLDNFIARYFSSPQGRFTSPDDPFAGSDPSDPQSWNLFSYGLNNPLRYSDPDGHDPCENGINPNNGAFCTVVTAEKPKADYVGAPLSTVLDMTANFMITVTRTTQQAQQFGSATWNFLSAPRDPSCLSGATGTGTAIGASAGLLGLAGGPAVGVTEPTGILIGGSAGWVRGMIMCSTGGGGGGGSDSSNTQHGEQRLSERGITDKQVSEAKETATQSGQVETVTGKYGTPVKIYKGTNGITVIEETAGRNAGKLITAYRH